MRIRGCSARSWWLCLRDWNLVRASQSRVSAAYPNVCVRNLPESSSSQHTECLQQPHLSTSIDHAAGQLHRTKFVKVTPSDTKISYVREVYSQAEAEESKKHFRPV